jgi:hypothetical protein
MDTHINGAAVRLESDQRRCCPVQERGVMSEFWNLVLLVLLYGMQGVPLGLCLGAMCAFR